MDTEYRCSRTYIIQTHGAETVLSADQWENLNNYGIDEIKKQ
jgi:hypothetical protein